MSSNLHTGETRIEVSSERELVMARSFDAPRELVFRAFSSPEHLPHWMLGPDGWEMTACEVDLRPGGRWRFAWRNRDGSTMEMGGRYVEVEPPARIVQTECWGGDWPETLNTLVLEEDDGRTTITQTVAYPSPEARDAALGSGMKEGASRSFERLAEHLSGSAR
jgi:uncharacterized protein YndB with AHSA1/START domain